MFKKGRGKSFFIVSFTSFYSFSRPPAHLFFLFLLSLRCLHFSREFYDPSACSFPVFFSYRPDHLPLLAQVGLPGAPFSFPLAVTNRRPPPVSISFLVPALGVGGHIVVVAHRSANELGSRTPLVLRSHTSPKR